jgi:hypothetical protein
VNTEVKVYKIVVNMAENRISAKLSAADRDAVMQAIATIREKLPFLIDLTTEDRRTIVKMIDIGTQNFCVFFYIFIRV